MHPKDFFVDGNKTVFVNKGNYLKLIFNNISYSSYFLNNSCEVNDIETFPDEEKGIIFVLRNRTGTVIYEIKKEDFLLKINLLG